MMRQSGFFDLQERYRKLSELGDPLEAIGNLADLAVAGSDPRPA